MTNKTTVADVISALNACERVRTAEQNNIGIEIAELIEQILLHYKEQKIEVSDTFVETAVIEHIKKKYPMPIELDEKFEPRPPSFFQKVKTRISSVINKDEDTQKFFIALGFILAVVILLVSIINIIRICK